MREPLVLPQDQSPFDFGASNAERRQRRERITADLITDEAGFIVGFRGEDDVDALLNDPRFSAIAMATLTMSGVTEGPLFDLWSLLMFGKDGNEHKRLRSTVAREFTPRAVEHYRADIAAYAGRLADGFPGDRTVELWSEFSFPLASRAACRVVGIPEADDDRVGHWALDLVNAFFFMAPERRVRAEAAAVEFSAYLDDHLAAKRATPGDDVVSRLFAADASHDLAYEEARALVANLVFGGLEATAKAITTGVFCLLAHDKWKELVADPSLALSTAVELLRFQPPTGVGRLASTDLECQGVQLHSGQMALLDISGACRDPRRYRDPDQLDLARAPGKQMAFGAGAHFCLGANLAKVVMTEGLAALATRRPGLELASAADAVEWDYETFEGIVSLPLRVTE